MSRPFYLHDPPFCSIVHSHKNLLECPVKASYSDLWFMFISPFALVFFRRMREGYLSVWYWYIPSVFYLFKILTDFFGSGVRQKVCGLWRKPFFSRVKSGTGNSLGHTNLDSCVNTGLEVVRKLQNIRPPVRFAHSGELESKWITPHARSAISTFICVVYRFKSCT